MSRRAFDEDNDLVAKHSVDPVLHPLACRAHGCMRLGNSSVEGGNLLCNAHGRAPPKDWNALTQKLRELVWLDQLVVRVNGCDTDQQWVTLSTAFWLQRGDEHMVPTGSELTRRGLYLKRLSDELLFRLGLNAVRPQPRVITPLVLRGSIPGTFTEPGWPEPGKR